ncbi:MAG: hypothetical protein NT075_20140 [Chloroflexi bacterium]|nr:hypothetical protein [Chloroflexota bacterium]
MSSRKQSGQAPFVFAHCEDLHSLPAKALTVEEKLHGGFAVDKRPGYGQVYYGMPGCGLLRISADLTTQDLIELPPDLTSVNFHSTKIGEFDGKMRLFLAANSEAKVVVASLDGDIDFILPRPEFDEYQNAETPFRPTDTVLNGNQLIVADGYGANYISTADLSTRQWQSTFGGKTENSEELGKFGTAHGMNRTPAGNQLAIADRPHSRFELTSFDGHFSGSYPIPAGSRPCGIDFIQRDNRWYAVVGSLDDPIKGRPAPIYILDAVTYEVLSTIRPKEDLGIERADHLHNVVWHEHNGKLFLVCQSWNPGYYFALELLG